MGCGFKGAMARKRPSEARGETAPLVRRWKAEGNAALQPLYERFRPDLKKCIQRLVGKRPPRGFEIEDLMQEVWQKVCRIHGKDLELSSPGSFRALLQKIAETTITSLYRAQRAQKRNEGAPDQALDSAARREGVPVHGPTRTPTPSRLAIADEIVERMKASLPESAFRAWYRVEEGLSPAELEAELGLTERHIRRLHRQGMKRLGEIVGEGGA